MITRNKGCSLIDFPTDFVVVDTETTGLDPSCCEIIEVAGIKYSNGFEIGRFSELIQPRDYYPAREDDDDYCLINNEKVVFVDSFITELTGITNKMLENTRPQINVFSDLRSFIGDSILIGHNVNYDVNFLYDAFKYYLGIEFTNDFIDTMRISRKLLKEELLHHRLRDVAAYYHIPQSGEHRALKDCETTYACYSCQLNQVIERYGSIETFASLFRKKASNSGRYAKSIVRTCDEIDEDSPIFGKEFVFTGTLDKMVRKEAMQIVVNKGGLCGDSVTKKTNYLVLGNNDYCFSIKNGKSNKQKKAELLKLSGIDIEIISENIFYEMIEE